MSRPAPPEGLRQAEKPRRTRARERSPVSRPRAPCRPRPAARAPREPRAWGGRSAAAPVRTRRRPLSPAPPGPPPPPGAAAPRQLPPLVSLATAPPPPRLPGHRVNSASSVGAKGQRGAWRPGRRRCAAGRSRSAGDGQLAPSGRARGRARLTGRKDSVRAARNPGSSGRWGGGGSVGVRKGMRGGLVSGARGAPGYVWRGR